MVKGYHISHPPGEALVTDRVCDMSGSGFCTFYNGDAMDGGECMSEDEYVCPGCNYTKQDIERDLEMASPDDVEASRQAKNPAYDGE